MNIVTRGLSSLSRIALAGCLLSLGTLAEAQHYQQANLVADVSGAAATPDSNLVNPWGLARGSTTPWWVANNGTGTSTLYTGAGVIVPKVVTVPAAKPGDMGVPSGMVFNKTADFVLTMGGPALFIFVTEDGTISGWNSGLVPADVAVVMKKPDGAVYKGAAIASFQGKNYLYVTNFARKRIDVFDTSFSRVRMSEEAFDDDRIPRGFSPFNVWNIGDNLYVTYAKVDPATHDDVKGAGLGFVDVFSPGGRLLRRLEHGDWLNAPWGLALAPSDFGAFSHHLLVGQFGSGEIAAYNLATGRFVGKVKDTSDNVLSIDGLWALSFGNGGSAGPLNTLFFTAGPDDESHGLFGTLTAVAAEQLLGNGK